ncbi:MAG: hypothetical protein GXP35_06445 [Actinobacteria bacterium]|nr:hypothetical protein [Actinomycetota bacterium]
MTLALLAAGCASSDGPDLTSPTTLVVEGSTETGDGESGAGTDIDVPTTATASGSDSSDGAPATTEPGSDTSDADASDSTDPDQSETVATFTSSPPNDGEKVGCPDGLILVGSNGEEPICSSPGQGCPDNYILIGGEDGAALCQNDEGLILRVYPDGTITPDTSVPFNGPVCRRLDENGLLVEFGLAASQEDCESRGGESLPDGLP